MFAAVYAARNGASVTIIEKNSCLGKKLSMTGNGRCNLTNLDMRGNCYNAAASERMKEWLSMYGVEDVISFFKSLGVIVKSEEGYIYPISGQAKTIVRALADEIKRLGVSVIYGEQLKSVNRASGIEGYEVSTNKNSYIFDRVIIATGSLSGARSTMSTGDGYYICRKLGMNIKDTYPALVGFKSAEDEIMPSQGVRSYARVSFCLGGEVLSEEVGEVQLNCDGISGIPVMQASRDVIRFVENEGAIVARLDFYPDYDDNDYESLKSDMMRLRDDRTLEEFLQGFANSNVTDMVLRRMKLSGSMKMKNISESMTRCILDNYRSLSIKIKTSYGYQASQVTSGGVSLGEIGNDMAYVKDPGIFIVGELLDVDGRCGGYNLQWAFTSGSIAGVAASI